MTGIKPVQYDTKVVIEGNLGLVTVVTTLAIFLVVALTYRSLVAPLVPLASIGLAEPEGGMSRGGHGSTQEGRVPLLISGAGVRTSAASKDARLVDVAPTIAAMLGARPPADAQGRVLDESLYG